MRSPTVDTSLLTSILALSLIVVGTACSRDAPPPPSIGANGDGGSLDEMDEDQLGDLCDEIDDRRSAEESAILQGGCKMGAHETVEDSSNPEQDCQVAYDQCVDAPENDPNTAQCAYDDPDALASCDATTGDVLDCIDEQIEGLATFEDQYTCAQAGAPLDDTLREARQKANRQGPACQQLIQDCFPGASNGGNDDVDNQNDNADEVDGDTLVSTMDDDELDAMCAESLDALNELSASDVCLVQAYVYGVERLSDHGEEPVAACNAYYDECSASDSPSTLSSCRARDFSEEERNNCFATYDEYIACRTEQRDGYDYFSQQFICEHIQNDGTVSDPTVQSAFEEALGGGETCSTVVEDCPAMTAD